MRARKADIGGGGGERASERASDRASERERERERERARERERERWRAGCCWWRGDASARACVVGER